MGPWIKYTSPTRAVPFLEDVDELPDGACGSLTFEQGRDPLGVILVQDRRICWATATGMRGRLTDILIGDSEGGLDRAGIEAVYARCRRNGTPLGEALVLAGVVSLDGLRAALLHHIAEALLTMGHWGRAPPRWQTHERGTYDARFTFSGSEVYTFLCSSVHADHARVARTKLETELPEGCVGAAFVRDGGGRPVALRGDHALRTQDLVELGRWVTNSIDVAGALAEHPYLVVFSVAKDAAALWRYGDCFFLALCREPSQLTYVMVKRRAAMAR